jgi:hypothetical protein
MLHMRISMFFAKNDVIANQGHQRRPAGCAVENHLIATSSSQWLFSETNPLPDCGGSHP